MTDDDFLKQPMFTIESNRTEHRRWTLQATEATPERVHVLEYWTRQIPPKGDGLLKHHRSVIVTPTRSLITGYRPQGEDWLYRAYMDHHPDTAKPFPKRTLTHLAVLDVLYYLDCK